MPIRPLLRTGALGAEIKKACVAIERNAPRAASDPQRPRFHYGPPSGWINDPNGPIRRPDGLHLFYQTNPNADTWDGCTWGHTVSKDLIHWKHLPPVLAPEPERGEDHCYSGCTVAHENRVLAFYTSIGKERNAKTAAVQCVAVSTDPELRTFSKDPARPVLTEAVHGAEKIYEWRDPYVFSHDGKHFMVLGGSLEPDLGGRGVVALYRAEDAELSAWQYLGILHEHPDRTAVPNIECPNFIEQDGKWVLFYSPHGKTLAFAGSFDPAEPRFLPESSGTLDLGEHTHYYAPIALRDEDRTLVFGWIGGFSSLSGWGAPGERGWNGCLSLPRKLEVRPDGEIAVLPVAELDGLRLAQLLAEPSRPVEGEVTLPLEGDSYELSARLALGSAESVGLRLRRSDDGLRAAEIRYDGEVLEVAGHRVPFPLRPGETELELRIFLDRSVCEIYLNGRAAFTRVIDAELGDRGVSLFSRGGTAQASIDAWALDETVLER